MISEMFAHIVAECGNLFPRPAEEQKGSGKGAGICWSTLAYSTPTCVTHAQPRVEQGPLSAGWPATGCFGQGSGFVIGGAGRRPTASQILMQARQGQEVQQRGLEILVTDAFYAFFGERGGGGGPH